MQKKEREKQKPKNVTQAMKKLSHNKRMQSDQQTATRFADR
jgi:predicted Ser/Thr protein kinase